MAEEEQSNPLGGESLSQEEIDRMLAESAATTAVKEKQATVFRHTGVRYPDTAVPTIQAHDFANPLVIDDIVLRTLRQRHEEFAALLSARLSIFLRMDFNLVLQRISTVVYRRFTSTVSNPSHVALFKVEPLTGVGVFDISPQLGLSIVDRMLGGKGQIDGTTDGLTEIEMNLLDDVVHVTLEEWCRMWGGDRKLQATVIGRENGGRYLQTSASDTAMLVAVFEGSIGECTERIQIAMPFPSVEDNLRHIVALLPASGAKGKETRQASWAQSYNGIPLPMAVEWDAREMTVREVLQLSVGSVVKLPRDIIADTKVRLSNVTKFCGEIGLESGRLAIRIDQRISEEEV